MERFRGHGLAVCAPAPIALAASPPGECDRPTMRVAMRALASLVLAAAVAVPAAAQVNTEKMRLGANEPGWGGTLDVNASLQQGNTEREILGGGVRLQYAWPRLDADGEAGPDSDAGPDGDETEGPADLTGVAGEPASGDEEATGPANVIFLVSNYSFSRANDNRYVNNAQGHLRFIRQHSPRISFEVFGQYQFNEFIRLEDRFLAGGGGRFALVQGERTEVFAGIGYMLEQETLDLPAALPDGTSSEHHRSTNYVTVRYNSEDERLRLVQTLYAQPRFDRLEDFRLLFETSFEIQLFRQLALAISLNVTHDSEPPTGIKETDVVLSNSLRYSF